jgi:isochorismate pyruvate lyase
MAYTGRRNPGTLGLMTVQDQTIKPAGQCLSMVELRAEIDQLDRWIVRLLAERQRYIERAAEIKPHRQDVRDEDRVADVLAKVTEAAEGYGLDVEIARAVWRELMERSIALEMKRFEDLQRLK